MVTFQSLRHRIEAESKDAGLSITNLWGPLGAEDIGDAYITGKLGPLLVRFVRDRGQDWLEVGPMEAEPPTFYSFQDVQIAFGWKTVEQVLDMQDVEPLGNVLKLLASHWSEITRVLSGDASSPGWRRVEKAAEARGEAFVRRLR